MKVLILYFLVLGFICVRDLFKIKNFDDYVVAGRKLVLGHDGGTAFVVMTGVLIILYTLFGGQLSVVRTDALQFWIFALANLRKKA